MRQKQETQHGFPQTSSLFFWFCMHGELPSFQEVTVTSMMPVGKKYRPLITKTLLSGRTLETRADEAKIVNSGLSINFFASLQGNYDVLH